MKQLTILLILLFFKISTYAQPASNAKSAANSMMDSFAKGDMKTVASYLHPKEIAKQGGYDKLVTMLDTTRKIFLSQRLKYKSSDFDMISKIYSAGKELHCGIRGTSFAFGIPGNMIYEIELLGISNDEGKTWKFINIRDQKAAKIREMVPNYNEELLNFGQPGLAAKLFYNN